MFWGWVSSPNDSMWLGLGAGWERILSFLMIVPDVLSSVQLSCPCLAAGSWEAGSCPPSPGRGQAPQEGGVSLQEATSVCDGSQHPHSTFLVSGPQGPQTLPAASPPHPNTPRTLRAAPQILLTCSWLPHFHGLFPSPGIPFHIFCVWRNPAHLPRPGHRSGRERGGTIFSLLPHAKRRPRGNYSQ